MARPVPDTRQWEELAEAAGYRALMLACLCRVSLRQLERQFHSTFGRSPQSWLDERRIVAAKALLRSGRSVKATSSDLGFKQVSHFTRHFKLQAGITPGKFVRSVALEEECRPQIKNNS